MVGNFDINPTITAAVSSSLDKAGLSDTVLPKPIEALVEDIIALRFSEFFHSEFDVAGSALRLVMRPLGDFDMRVTSLAENIISNFVHGRALDGFAKN